MSVRSDEGLQSKGRPGRHGTQYSTRLTWTRFNMDLTMAIRACKMQMTYLMTESRSSSFALSTLLGKCVTSGSASLTLMRASCQSGMERRSVLFIRSPSRIWRYRRAMSGVSGAEFQYVMSRKALSCKWYLLSHLLRTWL